MTTRQIHSVMGELKKLHKEGLVTTEQIVETYERLQAQRRGERLS